MQLTQEYRENWSASSKIWFRFLFSYFSWYLLLFFVGGFLEAPLRWVGDVIFDISYTYDTTGYGSGDHTYAYITAFVTLFLGVLTGSIWTLLDRKRSSYNRMLYWLLVGLRILLVGAMLLYGFAKVFQIQFQPASLRRLLQPLGDFSPMGLAWTYMGYSKGFGLFAGLMEIVGGLLLIPRRTQTLGAFIVAGVMTQVAMMNLMFDIPVKLFSIHLVVIALVIFCTDIKRFTAVFIKNKAVAQYDYYHPVTKKVYHKTIFWVKIVGLVVVCIGMSIFAHNIEKQRSKTPVLYGIWEVELFVKNQDTIPPLLTNNARWRYLIVDKPNVTMVRSMTNKNERYSITVDSTHTQVRLQKRDSEAEGYNFKNTASNGDRLELKGVIEQDTLRIALKRKDLNDFLLRSRGFHWINETPFNR